MHYFYFDTSALAKRYSPESGSEKYDSIHLALALELSELNPTVVTSDTILYKTCQSEGLTVINPEQ